MADGVGGAHDDGIAGNVTAQVVDHLKIIDVYKQRRVRSGVAGQRLVDGFHRAPAVEQPCEAVADRVLVELPHAIVDRRVISRHQISDCQCQQQSSYETANADGAKTRFLREIVLQVEIDGVSIGIAVHEGANTDFTQMYREADIALIAAREEGKSRIGRYVPTVV